MGIEQLAKKLSDETLQAHFDGIFPKDSVENARFSINFFTSIGLGRVTEDLREFIKSAPKLLLEKKYAELLAQANASSSSDESSSSSDSESDSSSSSSSDSEDSDDNKGKSKGKRR